MKKLALLIFAALLLASAPVHAAGVCTASFSVGSGAAVTILAADDVTDSSGFTGRHYVLIQNTGTKEACLKVGGSASYSGTECQGIAIAGGGGYWAPSIYGTYLPAYLVTAITQSGTTTVTACDW